MVSLGVDSQYRIERMRKLILRPEFTGEAYRWTLKDSEGADSTVSTEREFIFVAEKPGTYALRLDIIDAQNPVMQEVEINVEEESVAYSRYITEVYEYCPAPGQFVNIMPLYEEGDTEEDMCRKARESISGTNDIMISLGGYGVAEETPVDVTSSMSMGWNFPLYEQVTTGPVAALHYDGTTTSMYNEFGDSTTTLADPLWHASVSTLGWRVDSRLGDLRPWAQISYNQQFGENIWKAQSGLSRMTATNQNGNWLDVTVGADMLLNQNIAAYAALSQAENTTNNSDYLYTMGVSARF